MTNIRRMGNSSWLITLFLVFLSGRTVEGKKKRFGLQCRAITGAIAPPPPRTLVRKQMANWGVVNCNEFPSFCVLN